MNNIETTHKLIANLLEFTERFAHLNGEPAGGHCRETIRKAQNWLEFGSATLDPARIKADLVSFVQRYADMEGETEGGACRALLARAVYRLPVARDVSPNWDGRARAGFEPTPNQALVIDAVQAALDAGKFYSDEVVSHCATALGLAEEDRQANFSSTRVEGGVFGMDCYYARDYLRHCKEREMEAQASAMLHPCVSMKLGTLVFNDGKRVTGCHIVEVKDDAVVLSGKRGAKSVALATTSLVVLRAMDRACERHLRPDDGAAFVSSNAPDERAREVPDVESVELLGVMDESALRPERQRG